MHLLISRSTAPSLRGARTGRLGGAQSTTPTRTFFANDNKSDRARSTNSIPMRDITTGIAHQGNYSITKPKFEARNMTKTDPTDNPRNARC